jgi:hydroxyethylthiazole kinase-like uncharacterized protein yjeF
MSGSPIYATSAIRKLEELARAAPGASVLMERAGRSTTGALNLMERAGVAAAELARSLCGDTAGHILVVAGPGNNGGDAFEVAARLKGWFYRVSAVFAGERTKLSRDAQAALAKWEAAGGTLLGDIPNNMRFDLAVDGLFGIGLTRPLTERYAALVDKLNALRVPVLALDIPSGINADTGAVTGTAVRATHTITFIARKPGLLTLDGPDHCGEIHLDTLGVDAARLLAPEGQLLGAEVLERVLPPRAKNFHKGQAGSVGILGGAAGMVGAALIAGRAALKCGAGRVYLGLLSARAPTVDYSQPELMLRKPKELLAKGLVNALIAGPGMGTGKVAGAMLRAALKSPAPLVLDADALNLVAGRREMIASIGARSAATVLTPHPAEAARLLGEDTRRVQADRITSARLLAQRYHGFVVLKGNGSVIAAPGGKWWINPTGNPGMACAGMGDALTGMLAALLAQGAEPLSALLAGVYLHGAAADDLVAGGTGPVGITASEVIDRARALLNRSR